MKTLRNFSFLLLLGFSSGAFAQGINFIQRSAAPLYFNPAFAGATADTRFSAVFLHDWLAIPGAPQNLYLSYDQLSNKLKGGIGVELRSTNFSKGAGNWNGISTASRSIAVAYAGKITFGNSWTLSPAIKLSYQYNNDFWRRIDYTSRAAFSKQYNGGSLNIMPGLLLNSPSFYLGVSADNLTLYTFSDTTKRANPMLKVPPRLSLQTGYNIQPLNRKWSLSFSAMTNFEQDFWSFQGQSILRLGKALAGGGFAIMRTNLDFGFHNSNNIFLSLGFKSQRIKVLGSYNYDFGKLSNSISGGSAEIALSVYLPRKIASAGMAAL